MRLTHFRVLCNFMTQNNKWLRVKLGQKLKVLSSRGKEHTL